MKSLSFKLSFKFGELKWNPCWLIMLTSSYGTNHVLNEHEDVDQYGSFAIPPEMMLYQSHPESLVNQNEILFELTSSSGTTIWYNATSNLSWKCGESKWNPYWLIMLASSSCTNYVLNEHECVDQYGSFATPPQMMLYQSHPEWTKMKSFLS